MSRRMINLAIVVTAVTLASLAAGMLVQRAFTNSEVDKVSTAKRSLTSRIVVLQGQIHYYSPSENVFTFSDKTGTIELQMCPTWYKQIHLKNGESTTITGHILSRRAMAPDAQYVLAVHTIDRSNGDRIVLRTTTGKPPWASSAHIPEVQ